MSGTPAPRPGTNYTGRTADEILKSKPAGFLYFEPKRGNGSFGVTNVTGKVDRRKGKNKNLGQVDFNCTSVDGQEKFSAIHTVKDGITVFRRIK